MTDVRGPHDGRARHGQPGTNQSNWRLITTADQMGTKRRDNIGEERKINTSYDQGKEVQRAEKRKKQ